MILHAQRGIYLITGHIVQPFSFDAFTMNAVDVRLWLVWGMSWRKQPVTCKQRPSANQVQTAEQIAASSQGQPKRVCNLASHPIKTFRASSYCLGLSGPPCARAALTLQFTKVQDCLTVQQMCHIACNVSCTGWHIRTGQIPKGSML